MNIQITKNQHFIPASCIGLFSNDPLINTLRKSKIWFYDKRSDKIMNLKAEDKCSEERYFELKGDHIGFTNNKPQINFVEKNLNSIELNFIKLLQFIEKNDKNLSSNELNILLEYMTILYLRTPKIRDEKTKVIANEISIQLREKNTNIIGDEVGKVMLNLSTLKYGNIYNEQFKKFNQYKFFLIKDINNNFISSDHPVIFGSKYILFPISKKYCLLGSINKNIEEEISKTEFINKVIAIYAENIIFGKEEITIKYYKDFITDKDLNYLRLLDL